MNTKVLAILAGVLTVIVMAFVVLNLAPPCIGNYEFSLKDMKFACKESDNPSKLKQDGPVAVIPDSANEQPDKKTQSTDLRRAKPSTPTHPAPVPQETLSPLPDSKGHIPQTHSNKKDSGHPKIKPAPADVPAPSRHINLNGQFIVKQSNDAEITFQLSQNANKLDGIAVYPGVTGVVNGILSGDGRAVDITVDWSSTSKGRYVWKIDPNCHMVSGQTIDLAHPGSSASITSISNFCQ